MMQQANAGMSSGMSGDAANLNPSAGAGTSNEDAGKEEGEQTPELAGQNNDAMNSMMQMGFPMNPEQMQQQMMMMQQQMMGSNMQNNTAEGDANNAQAGASGNAEDGNQQQDMQAMMAAMGGMPGMDMQTMMSMFGMGMPGMGNMNGMSDMSGFQNMAQMSQGEYSGLTHENRSKFSSCSHG